MSLPSQSDTLPNGVTLITEPWVSLDGCAECGRESGDGYNVMVSLAEWEHHVHDMDWQVVDGRLLCYDCAPYEPLAG